MDRQQLIEIYKKLKEVMQFFALYSYDDTVKNFMFYSKDMLAELRNAIIFNNLII